MVKVLITAFLAALPFLTFSANATGLAAARDSVGVERRNGKLYVQHKVEPKETLYALSRIYNIPVAQIVEANPSVESTIKIGQVVLIPRMGAMAGTAAAKTTAAVPHAPQASNRTYTVNDRGEKTHTVQAGQTLYAVSRMYAISVEDLKSWNNLQSNSINIGDKLIVGMGVAKPTKSPVYVPEADDEIAATPKSSSAEPVATVPAAAAERAAPVGERESETESTETEVKKVVESGIAEMIDPKADTNKYLALHKSAPVGTIMQVKNAMNGQVVYVRVIGKLPDTGINDKVLVRISKKACQKLGAIDQKFRVEVSYMP